MAKTLEQYAEWLDERKLIWPQVPQQQAVEAVVYTKPLPGIAAVTFELYGTLLHISEGELLHQHSQKLRMKIALEKTIEEFNMWNSMYRTKDRPWEYMQRQYLRFLEDMQLTGTGKLGRYSEINSADLWQRVIVQLQQKEFSWNESEYGDEEEFSLKVAYFFHRALQGLAPMKDAQYVLETLRQSHLKIGLLADAQPFSLMQLLRAFGLQGTLPELSQFLSSSCITLSYRENIRKPSRALYERCLVQFAKIGVSPAEVLHVGTRVSDDLAVAKQLGMKTVLFSGNQLSLKANREDMQNRDVRPDRLITELTQLYDILDY